MKAYTAAILLFLTPFLPAQGPLDGFLKGKKRLDLAPSFSLNSARTFAAAGGQTYDLRYKGNLLSLFAEYGLSKRADVVATAAYVFTSSRSGLQDGGLYVKYRPLHRSLGAGGQLGVLFATGLGFPLTNYEPSGTGALGQKMLVVPLRLIVQWEMPLGLFLNLTGGYSHRFDRLRQADIDRARKQWPDYVPVQPADFSTLLFKIGFPAARVYADAWVERQWAHGGADYRPDLPGLPQSFGVSYTQAGGTFYYSERGKQGVYLSGACIFEGRNTSRIVRVTVGVVFKLGQGPPAP